MTMDFTDLMKKTLSLMVALTMGFFTACSGSDEDEPEVPKDFTLSTQEMNFTSKGGEQTFSVQSDAELTVKSSAADWCKVANVASGSTKTQKFQVTVASYTKNDDREATIIVSLGSLNKTIKVKQTAADGLEVDTKTFENIPAGGGEITVKLKANADYVVTPNVSWITEKKAARASMTASELTFVVALNRSTEPREGTITIQLNDLKATVTVKQQAGTVAADGDFADGDAQSIAYQIGLGWNLGNQFDAQNNGVAGETAWGNPKATQATFDKVKAAGFTSVRIPITWLGKVGAAPSYTIDKAWLDRIEEVIGYAEAAGLKAIINIHHDGANSEYWLDIKNAAKDAAKNTEIKNKLYAMWNQIAERFKNKGNFLIFESMNEIHDGGWGWGDNRNDGGKQYKVLNEWNQTFVDAVRDAGGENMNRYLGVPGYCTNIDLTVNHFVMPTDKVQNRLLVAVHCYDPNTFAIEAQKTEWGHTGKDKESWGNEDDIKNAFNKMKTNFVDKNIPVYIGEMGCVHFATERSESFRKYYLEYVCKAARTYGLAPIYWDNGATGTGRENFGLLNHGTGAYINNGEEIIATMVKGYFTDSADYTLESVYNNAPK